MMLPIEQRFPIVTIEFVGLRKDLAYLGKLGGDSCSEIPVFVLHSQEMQKGL
jgi:hypothetical protein